MTKIPTWKKQGFSSRSEYQENLAKKKGFESHVDYRNYLARKKGFASDAEYIRSVRKTFPISKTKMTIEEQEKKDEILRYNIELRKKGACNILKKHHKTMKDDPESFTTEFLQEQINITCDITKKANKKKSKK